MAQNAIPPSPNSVADRIAQRALAKRGETYASEVRRLLDAGLEVMRACGTTSRPRVADIVAAAGLSNEAFYRHFPSKDALVTAIVENGAERLASYVAHQMEKEGTPEGKVRRWVAGVLSQAEGDTAETTLAVLWNGTRSGDGLGVGRAASSSLVAALLHEPFEQLGSADPVLDAALVGHAVFGKLTEYLWRCEPPTRADVEHITAFSLRVVTATDRT